MPAKRCTAWRAIARIIAWSPPSSARMSRWAISSAVSESIPPEPPRPSAWPCSSCIARHMSSASEPSPSTRRYCGPRRLKYTSNTVSNERQWALFFTSVAPRAYLNASRSSIGMCCTASIASRFSVRLTGRPALRSSTTKPLSSSIIFERGAGASRSVIT